MNIKAFLILLNAFFLFTDAVKVSDEDVYSPLVSYLLTKLQQLESKMMAKSIPKQRSDREVAEVSANNAQSSSPPSPIVTYTRWGNSSCPFGASTVYRGVAAGGAYSHKGSPVNLMCLPPDPMRYPNNAEGSALVYPVEYQTGGPLNHAHNRNMPCAVCEVTGKSTTLMIPSHYECPTGWRHEYHGYIMAGHYTQEAASMYNCVDVSLEQIPGTGSLNGWHLLHPTNAATSSDSLPYDGGYAMSCVVCSK